MPAEINLVGDKSIPYIRYGIYPYNTVIEQYALYLPMPTGLNTSDDAEWEAEDNWGVVAAVGAGKTLGSARSGFESGKGGGTGTMASLKGAGQAISDVGKVALSIGANALGNISPTSKNLARGKTINLQKEHFYKGKSFRSFTFTHNLNADRPEESLMIREIIKIMRTASSPGVSDVFFTWPSDIIPRFYTGIEEDSFGRIKPQENPWLPKIERCVIKSVEVNYATQEPYHQHRDGSPTLIEMAIELEEIVQQTKGVINSPHHERGTGRPSLHKKFVEAEAAAMAEAARAEAKAGTQNQE